MGSRNAALKLVIEPRPFPELVSGKTALMIIDMTYKDAHPDYGMGRLLREQGLEDIHRDYYRRVGMIIPNIQRLRSACHDAAIDVVNVHVAASTTDCRDMIRSFKRADGMTQPMAWAPAGSTESEIVKDVAPEPGEIVVRKTSGSVFNSSNVDRILRNIGIETLVTTGVLTNGCVELSSRDAADLGYDVVLVSDATTALTIDEHEDAVARMDGVLIHARTTAEVGSALLKSRTPTESARGTSSRMPHESVAKI